MPLPIKSLRSALPLQPPHSETKRTYNYHVSVRKKTTYYYAKTCADKQGRKPEKTIRNHMTRNGRKEIETEKKKDATLYIYTAMKCWHGMMGAYCNQIVARQMLLKTTCATLVARKVAKLMHI